MFNPGDKLLNDERYEIEEQVGRGGMGIVYKAHDANLERLVAIKVLPPEISGDRRAIRDLKHEARTAAKLRHENIVVIHDLCEWEGHHLIIMEFVDGQTLDDIVIDNFPLPIEQVLDITIQICTGLQYIHDHQILHRDIKPKNIMVIADGLVKITDFGIAHVVKQTVTRLTGRTTGTMPYLAPEQFLAKSADARSDIYALGISLYEILTNDLPFPGPDFAFQHREVEVESPTERKPNLNIPPELSAVVMKCLEKNPEDRYTSVSELRISLVALQQCLSDAEKIPELIQQARSQHDAENYQEAIQIWQRILVIAPNNEDAKSGIACIQKILVEQQAEEERQAKIDTLFSQAQEEAAAENYQKVIELSQKVLEIDPDNAAARSGLESAEKSLAKKRAQEERQQKECERQAKIQSLFCQAQEEAAAGNYQKAIELSQQVLKIDPNNAAAKSGIESIQRTIKDQQKKRDRLIRQAQDKHQAGNFEEAVQIWKRVLETDPENQTAKLGLESAEKSLAEQQQRERDRLIRQAQDKQRAGNLEEAIQLWGKVLRMDPGNQTAKLELETAEKSLGEQHRKRDLLIAQAQDQERNGNLETAIQTWEKVLQLDPENQTAKSSIEFDQKILTEEKERERKERERQIQIERQRQNQIRSLITQAQNEEKSGNLENALQTWQRALQIAPDNTIAQSGVTRTQNLLEQRSTRKKIDYAVAASATFIHHLHRDGLDRCMIATFGNTFRIEQRFTSSKVYLHSALRKVSSSITNERTRLYDSIEDVIVEFWQHGRRDCPWILTIITDGQDNESRKYKNNPMGIGLYIDQRFNHEPTNFPFLIGVGEGRQIDAGALEIMGKFGGFPAVTIAAFPLLEVVFMEIAVKVSTQLVGRRIQVGNLSWDQIAKVRQLSHTPIDYAFLLDRSGSMGEPG